MKWYEKFPEAVTETRREERRTKTRDAVRRYQKRIEQAAQRMQLTTLRVPQ